MAKMSKRYLRRISDPDIPINPTCWPWIRQIRQLNNSISVSTFAKSSHGYNRRRMDSLLWKYLKKIKVKKLKIKNKEINKIKKLLLKYYKIIYSSTFFPIINHCLMQWLSTAGTLKPFQWTPNIIEIKNARGYLTCLLCGPRREKSCPPLF